MEGIKNSPNTTGAIEPKAKKKAKKDIYKDTPIRKLGFLDEYGEALRPVLAASSNPIVKQLPNLAYIPATAYIALDVADKYKKGVDGTGEKPSVKMAAREAAYQGIVSVLAPAAIVRGTHKLTQKAASKIPDGIRNTANVAAEGLKKNKTANKILTKAGMPVKIAGALISIFAVSHLTKPVDKIVGGFFNRVVDPAIGISEKDKK